MARDGRVIISGIPAPHHADKQRVKIRAVATLGGAGPYCIAVAPPGAGLVVAHSGDDVVVDGPRFRKRGLGSHPSLAQRAPR